MHKRKSERALVLWLSFLIGCGICTVMALPFVLAILFGEGWLYLNFITVPGYLYFVYYIDRRARRGDKQ